MAGHLTVTLRDSSGAVKPEREIKNSHECIKVLYPPQPSSLGCQLRDHGIAKMNASLQRVLALFFLPLTGFSTIATLDEEVPLATPIACQKLREVNAFLAQQLIRLFVADQLVSAIAGGILEPIDLATADCLRAWRLSKRGMGMMASGTCHPCRYTG